MKIKIRFAYSGGEMVKGAMEMMVPDDVRLVYIENDIEPSKVIILDAEQVPEGQDRVTLEDLG